MSSTLFMAVPIEELNDTMNKALLAKSPSQKPSKYRTDSDSTCLD